MPVLKAILLTSQRNEWLANSRRPRILHIFDRACNLINERGEVLSIVTSQSGEGPFNLVFERDILISQPVSLPSQVSIHTDQLNLGNWTIYKASAKLGHTSGSDALAGFFGTLQRRAVSTRMDVFMS